MINKKLIKNRFYTTLYFSKTKKILENESINKNSTLQFKCFDQDAYMVCGIKESIEILKAGLTKSEFQSLKIKYYPDGTIIYPKQSPLSIEGRYSILTEFENIIDGVLARRSSVATNCWKMLKLISSDKLVFMSDRSDDYLLHPYDGYSAYIAGVRNFSNYSHIKFIKNKKDIKVFGSMPHALIHQFNGDIIKTYLAYRKVEKNNQTVLVDFDNDIIDTLSKLTPYFKNISAIRLDTSNKLIDKSLQSKKNSLEDYGVNHKLILIVRDFLNNNFGKHIKIVSSSDNSLEKIAKFKKLKTPIDSYGIGSSLTKLNLHFTADLVKIENTKFAKIGREFFDDSKMIEYK